MKVIIVHAKDWFDKVNGNSYFSVRIMVQKKQVKELFCIPFQYGYGDHYRDIAIQELEKLKILKKNEKVKPVYIKQENCLKKEVLEWGRLWKT